MSPHLPVTPRGDRRRRRSARPRPAPRSCTCTRANPHDGQPDQIAGGLRAVPAGDQAALELRRQHHDRRRADDDDRGAAAARGDLQARGRLAQHGLDELRALSRCSTRFKEFKHDWERPYLEGSRDRIFRNTFADIEYILTHLRRERHALRDRVLRHRPPLHARPFRRPRPGQAAALHPDRVRHPRRHRPASRGRGAHEAHRRPAVRRRVPLVRARRRAQPAADRRHGRGDGRQRPRRARGLAVDRRRASSPNPTPQQVRAARQIIEGLGLEVATPDEAREILELKGGDRVNF